MRVKYHSTIRSSKDDYFPKGVEGTLHSFIKHDMFGIVAIVIRNKSIEIVPYEALEVLEG